jgi:hypothetical protein
MCFGTRGGVFYREMPLKSKATLKIILLFFIEYFVCDDNHWFGFALVEAVS